MSGPIALPVRHAAPFDGFSPEEAEDVIADIQARNRARVREIVRGIYGEFDRKADAERAETRKELGL